VNEPALLPVMQLTPNQLAALAAEVKDWAQAAGFDALAVADVDLRIAEARLRQWLEQGRHGEMRYFERNTSKRTRPAELVPGTLRVLSARLNYMPPGAQDSESVLDDARRAFISRYALGRDYHKVMRGRLRQLAERIEARVGLFGYRVFSDSAPVMEVELAVKAGLGWRGKHTLLLHRSAGSYFFLGEIYTDLPLPIDGPQQEHCGTCTRCIDVCPTGAIVAPYQLDARRCISYLTIEHPGSIPEELRPLIGNRVYGCDDCQMVCPWNRFAQISILDDLKVRHGLDRATLLELFAWTQSQFNARTEGSAIRRIGYERWLRNLAVALGNAPGDRAVLRALVARMEHRSQLVRSHVAWAIERQREKLGGGKAGDSSE
jgi:epoxyqueuosine reductase